MELEAPGIASILPGLPHITTGAFEGFGLSPGGIRGLGVIKVGGTEGHWRWACQGHILRGGMHL